MELSKSCHKRHANRIFYQIVVDVIIGLEQE